MRLFFFLLFLSFFFSCNENEKLKLSDSQYVDLLTDMEIMEALLENKTGWERDSLNTVYYTKLSKKYNLTPQEIKENVSLLFKNPKKNEQILELVSVKLTQIKDSLGFR